MNYFDLLAFVCAPSPNQAMEVWKQCHPGKNPIWATFDPDVKAFWKSPIGRLALWGVRPIWEIKKIPHYWRLVKLQVWRKLYRGYL